MILYNGQASDGSGDFVSLGLNKGVPEFRFDVGSGMAVIRASHPIQLSQWHTIQLQRLHKDGLSALTFSLFLIVNFGNTCDISISFILFSLLYSHIKYSIIFWGSF